ncbi:MAG: hypothetical protein AABX59_02690 [Nanoarchaeota archaeon]
MGNGYLKYQGKLVLEASRLGKKYFNILQKTSDFLNKNGTRVRMGIREDYRVYNINGSTIIEEHESVENIFGLLLRGGAVRLHIAGSGSKKVAQQIMRRIPEFKIMN